MIVRVTWKCQIPIELFCVIEDSHLELLFHLNQWKGRANEHAIFILVNRDLPQQSDAVSGLTIDFPTSDYSLSSGS